MTPSPLPQREIDVAEIRDLELILLHNGGAELIDFSDTDDGVPLWSSDSDNDFRDEFPDFLSEGEVERVQDYLIERDIISTDEADEMEISIESLAAVSEGPGDEEEDDGDDDD